MAVALPLLVAGAGIGYAASTMAGGPKPPPPPPPPPNAPDLSRPSIAEQGAAERASLTGAEGAGFNNTDVTGGSGGATPAQTTAGAQQTKSVLGG